MGGGEGFSNQIDHIKEICERKGEPLLGESELNCTSLPVYIPVVNTVFRVLLPIVVLQTLQRKCAYVYTQCVEIIGKLNSMNRHAEENAAWIQLFRLSQQFPEIWEFVYYLDTQNPRFQGIADSGETVESRPHFPPRPG